MFADRLKELRAAKGISQAALANVLGISQQAIGKWECNKSTPDYDTLKNIAKYFNVSTDYLLDRTTTETTLDDEDTFDKNIRMLARDKLKSVPPEEREKRKEKILQLIEMMFE